MYIILSVSGRQGVLLYLDKWIHWLNKVCACVCRERECTKAWSFNATEALSHREIGWLLIDLIILLPYKDKRWMPSYLLGNKMNKPAKDEGEDIKHFEPQWKDVSVPTVRRSSGKLYLQTNLLSVPREAFFLLDVTWSFHYFSLSRETTRKVKVLRPHWSTRSHQMLWRETLGCSVSVFLRHKQWLKWHLYILSIWKK